MHETPLDIPTLKFKRPIRTTHNQGLHIITNRKILPEKHKLIKTPNQNDLPELKIDTNQFIDIFNYHTT
jgi:hypothetical protein